MENGAEYNAEGDAHDATFKELDAKDIDAASENQNTDENADVVESRGEGKKDETTNGLLDGGEDGGDGEKKRVNGDDAHHVDG